VRIGREHLRALLDVWDPYHADVSVNRVRLALLAGYPKQVRLAFASGFAAIGVELGGLAGLVRIDELRGLPIGPALAHYLAPILER
jgi:translocation and assembly module TamB